MAHTLGRETEDARHDYMLLGEVVENADPLGLGRVRTKVPGLLDPESNWALPIGAMFGIKNGIHWVPEKGSNVIVFLNQGDVDHPYYIAGPFGSPDGNSDVPEQAPTGSVDHMVIRWRDFHFTINGKSGEESLTIQDLVSGTKLEIERTTGDHVRDVEHDEVVTVLNDLDMTIEQGDERRTITTGKRTTTIQGNDEKTIVAGDEVKTLTAGNKVQTLVAGNETKTLTAGSSTENLPAGAKVITTGLGISLTAGGVISLLGSGVSVNSGGGTTTNTSGGLVTNTFLGGLTSVITGAFSKTINGVASWILNGAASFVGTVINIGAGPTYKKVLNEDLIAAFNAHTHTDSMSGTTTTPDTTITPGGTAPFDKDDMVSLHVGVS